MPPGDTKHRTIHADLVSILGPQYVMNDIAVTECYTRESQTPSFATRKRAEFVVLPGNPEDIQQIVKLANRLLFPFSVIGS